MKYDFKKKVVCYNDSAMKTSKEVINSNLGLNYYDDSISMWIADMDFFVAPKIVEAIKERANAATFGYTEISDEYYSSVCNWYERRHNMKFSKNEVFCSHGTIAAIRNVIRTFTKEGDGVIIQPPVYYPFFSITTENKRVLVENNLLVGEGNRYSIDFEDFEKKCADSNNKLFIFCNPHNPIGQIWKSEDVKRLLDICDKYGVLFFSDEVHADIVRNDCKFVSTLNMGKTDGLIVATAANKTFNLAGLHITNVIIPNADLHKKLDDYTGKNLISPFAESAAIAAYNECEDWVDEMRCVIDENIAYVYDFIKENLPRVRFNSPEGTYLLWLDFRDYNMAESDLLNLISEKAHVIVEGGKMFCPNVEGFVRMNVACPKTILVEALNRIKSLF